MRIIIIKPALNGYIVQVGCQTVVFESREKLLLSLGDYLKDPNKVEQEFLNNAVNKSFPLEQPSQQLAADNYVSASTEAIR